MTTSLVEAPLVEALNVSRRFSRKLDYAEKIARFFGANLEEKTVHAVDGVNLAVYPGEVVGLVGESGCGKSTLGRVMAGIMPASDGEVRWKDKPLTSLKGEEKRAMRLSAQMIFQDPMSTLNPRKRVIDLIGEAPKVHGIVKGSEMRDYVASLAERVGLDATYLDRYPHQFSGGQRQRIGIARAALLRPDFVLADEIVSGLDVSTQAQVLNLLKGLSREMGLSMAFISHDLSVIRAVCDRVYVLRLGKIVEHGPCQQVFGAPQSAYTKVLLDAIPLPEIDPTWLMRSSVSEDAA